ncbi:MAG: cytochrome P450 [Myxococcales bacterium]|nr:cytochrome P450 [Myxococcales bacterium]
MSTQSVNPSAAVELDATDLVPPASEYPVASFFPRKKSERHSQVAVSSPLEVDAEGVWHIYGYELARAFLRAEGTRQAGFRAELMDRLTVRMRPPVLYQHGTEHHRQRRMIARFFTPKTTSEKHRSMMERCAEELIARLRRNRQSDLSELSLAMSVQVAAHVVGLTDSRLSGMHRRIATFLDGDPDESREGPVGRSLLWLRRQADILKFLYLDVVPAINARRRSPQEDVISHLLAQGSTLPEILTECLTYAAAGMVTTREFICMAAWHLLASPELRNLYVSSSEATRHRMLQEALRLEPVVGVLKRRTAGPFVVRTGGIVSIIPAGSLIHVHVGVANLDPHVVGACPRALCPERPLPAGCVSPALLSFGEGEHRCPGSYIAMQESDIFLLRLLTLNGLHIKTAPTLSWGAITQGYELRKFMVAIS